MYWEYIGANFIIKITDKTLTVRENVENANEEDFNISLFIEAISDEESEDNRYEEGWKDGQRALLLKLLSPDGICHTLINFVNYLKQLENKLRSEE